MEKQNQSPSPDSPQKYRSFWYIVILAVLSALVGGLLTYAIFNQGLEEDLVNLVPGTRIGATKKYSGRPASMNGEHLTSESALNAETRIPNFELKISSSTIESGMMDYVFYADGKEIGSLRFPEVGMPFPMTVQGGNANAVYFSLTPDGLGGWYPYSPPFNLYKADLVNRKISLAINDPFKFGLQSLEFNPSQTKFAYVFFERDHDFNKTKLVIRNLTDEKDTAYELSVYRLLNISKSYRVGNIKFSPSESKLAFPVALWTENNGEELEMSAILVLDLKSGKVVVDQELGPKVKQVIGWENENVVRWKYTY